MTDPVRYCIKVRGAIDRRWTEWFDDAAITIERDRAGTTTTILTGLVADQAALRGLLSRLWDLNLTVISVNPEEQA